MPAEPCKRTINCVASNPRRPDTLTVTFDGSDLYFEADGREGNVSVFPSDKDIQALADILNAYLEHKGARHA